MEPLVNRKIFVLYSNLYTDFHKGYKDILWTEIHIKIT